MTGTADLELADWRRRVSTLYAAVRDEQDPAHGHALWMSGQDDLFQHHAQSPLLLDDPLHQGIPYWPYDSSLRFELEPMPPDSPTRPSAPTGGDETTTLDLGGHIELPDPLGASVAVWCLAQYAGGGEHARARSQPPLPPLVSVQPPLAVPARSCREHDQSAGSSWRAALRFLRSIDQGAGVSK